jgi:hypothetical protein
MGKEVFDGVIVQSMYLRDMLGQYFTGIWNLLDWTLKGKFLPPNNKTCQSPSKC